MEIFNRIFDFLIGLFAAVVIIAVLYGVFYKPPKDPPDYFDRG